MPKCNADPITKCNVISSILLNFLLFLFLVIIIGKPKGSLHLHIFYTLKLSLWHLRHSFVSAWICRTGTGCYFSNYSQYIFPDFTLSAYGNHFHALYGSLIGFLNLEGGIVLKKIKWVTQTRWLCFSAVYDCYFTFKHGSFCLETKDYCLFVVIQFL